MITEAAAVGALSAALVACCCVAGLRRPHVGRLATTGIVSVVAGSTISLAVVALVAGDPDPDSIAVPVGSTFLVLGILIAAIAGCVQLGGEVGRWLAAGALGLLGSVILWFTVSEPVQENTASGSVLVLLVGLSFIGCTALLVGGSNVVNRWSGGPVPSPSDGFPAAVGERPSFKI